MKQFDVSTDSTCDLYKDYVEKRNIYFAPLSFSLEKDGKQTEYLDHFEKYEEYVHFFEEVAAGATPKTAMLNYQAHVDHFTMMAKAGVKDVLHFSISSGLARTCSVAKEAAEEVKKEYPDFNLYSVDPLHATIGQGILVSLAADLRDQGKSAKEAFEYLTEARLRLQCCIIPTDLFYLQRGGRVSKTAAVFGSMLNIKPILNFDSEGKLRVVDKCKGLKKAFAYVLEKIRLSGLDETGRIVVVHTNNEVGANELATLIETNFGVKPEVVIMGPTIGTHVGPGSVSCGWMSNMTRKELTGF